MGASVSTMNQRTRKHRGKSTQQRGKSMKRRGKPTRHRRKRNKSLRKRRRRTQRGGGRYGFTGDGIPMRSVGSTDVSRTAECL